jgi:hypothetical protein
MTPDQITIGLVVLAGLGLVSIWTSGARTGKKAERAVREVTRIGGTAVRTVLTAAVLVGVQWAALTMTGDPVVWAVALGLPALFAGTTVARLLAVTEVIRTIPRHARGGRGGRR